MQRQVLEARLIISHSEVDSFLRCKRSHYYGYALGIIPNKFSRPNNIGNLGHHILETYYRLRMTGETKKDAFHGGMAELKRAKGHEDIEVIDLVGERFIQYVGYYDDNDFRILDVEGVHTLKLNDHITYGMTLDLLVEYTSGPNKGNIVVVDHKFKYNFETTDSLSMHVQTLKYIWALRKLGYPVKGSMLNQIRYRIDVHDTYKLFKRQPVPYTDVQLENIMQEHLYVAEEIYNTKTQPVSWYTYNAPRRLSPRECTGCYFRIPCRQELLGKDVSLTLTSMYSPERSDAYYRPYGY